MAEWQLECLEIDEAFRLHVEFDFRFHVLERISVHEQIRRLQIPADLWRTVGFALRDKGWHLDMGGGLDHSWAVLERNGMRIEMEYDIWSEGAMVMDAAAVAKITADLPVVLIRHLELP
jgi:hypothetical protein